MAFKEQVEETEDIKACYQRGLRALGSNSAKVKPRNTRKVEGSVFLEGCLQSSYPRRPLWDYMVGYNGEVFFIEVHPANTKNVGEMLSKLEWLQQWLNQSAKNFHEVKAKQKPFRWVATGSVSITKGSSQARKLANSALSFPEKQTKLPG